MGAIQGYLPLSGDEYDGPLSENELIRLLDFHGVKGAARMWILWGYNFYYLRRTNNLNAKLRRDDFLKFLQSSLSESYRHNREFHYKTALSQFSSFLSSQGFAGLFSPYQQLQNDGDKLIAFSGLLGGSFSLQYEEIEGTALYHTVLFIERIRVIGEGFDLNLCSELFTPLGAFENLLGGPTYLWGERILRLSKKDSRVLGVVLGALCLILVAIVRFSKVERILDGRGLVPLIEEPEIIINRQIFIPELCKIFNNLLAAFDFAAKERK